jgi:hypothetical protein
VPIWRAWRLSSADVLCARSVRGGQAQIGRYGRARSRRARMSDGARIAGSATLRSRQRPVVMCDLVTRRQPPFLESTLLGDTDAVFPGLVGARHRRHGVIATATGCVPTAMSVGYLVLVFTSIVETVPMPWLAT